MAHEASYRRKHHHDHRKFHTGAKYDFFYPKIQMNWWIIWIIDLKTKKFKNFHRDYLARKFKYWNCWPKNTKIQGFSIWIFYEFMTIIGMLPQCAFHWRLGFFRSRLDDHHVDMLAWPASQLIFHKRSLTSHSTVLLFP